MNEDPGSLVTPVCEHVVEVNASPMNGYRVRVPGPGDLWFIQQDGGEQWDGQVAGYGSESLRDLIVILQLALRDLEQHEVDVEARRALSTKEPPP